MLYVKYEKNWPTASEEKYFENVDDEQRTDGRTTDTSISFKLTYEPLFGSGELKSNYIEGSGRPQ